MRRLALAVLLVCGVASADPKARFGMTFGIDRNAPEAHEVGPLIGLGLSAGRFTGEVNYTYLSLMDPYESIHRVGVALRADIVRRCSTIDCTKSRALYGELGAAQRFGHWRVNDQSDYEATKQSEVYFAAGFELAEWSAWDLGLRFGLARRDPMLEVACRGVTCPVSMPASSGLAESVMLEWTWLIGTSSMAAR